MVTATHQANLKQLTTYLRVTTLLHIQIKTIHQFTKHIKLLFITLKDLESMKKINNKESEDSFSDGLTILL